MKKFIAEYKNLRCKSSTEITKKKWERVTVTRSRVPSEAEQAHSQTITNLGTIRTEEYKRDLAEFQARRSVGKNDLDTSVNKKKCGRHSLPVSCTNCTVTDLDATFNYEKKSGSKYKKNKHKRARSASRTADDIDGLPNIQFLFQNQVFMPGNVFAQATFSEPQKNKRRHKAKAEDLQKERDEFLTQKHLDFKDEVEQPSSPPLFFKNNSLPFDMKTFLEGSKLGEEEVDGVNSAGDAKVSGRSSASSRDDSVADKLVEVMSELKNFDHWADEQLKAHNSYSSTKSDDNKSDSSAYGLPVVSKSDLDVTGDKGHCWSVGTWGSVPVQVKKLSGVTLQRVRKRESVEVEILRTCRHPNIILLMGLFADIHHDVHLICEQCVDTLHNLVHVEKRVISTQTAVQYTIDITNAIIFLRMRGYVHTELSSHSVAVTARDTAKIADLGPSCRVQAKQGKRRAYDAYSPVPQYVNIGDKTDSNPSLDCEPLISAHPSSVYLTANAVTKNHAIYRSSPHYRWQAPELFEPDESGLVYPCSKSDVYSLGLILLETCTADIPFKDLTYSQLHHHYTVSRSPVQLPAWLGARLSGVLDTVLAVNRQARVTAQAFATALRLQKLLAEMEYVVIPSEVSKKKSVFSSVGWEPNSPTDSDCLSPITNIQHEAVIHNNKESSTESEREYSRSECSPRYETIRKDRKTMFAESCYIPEDETDRLINYDRLRLNECSSACSTPVAKIKARLKDIGTPGLHRSDSTEYCSILSPENRNFALNEDSNREQSATEKSSAKLSRSFTPKSYKPLHIKVPDFKLDCIKSLPKEQNGSERSSYNFDIKNYSLPSTPIARSNKLRKNAWLSGELGTTERETKKCPSPLVEDPHKAVSAPETDTNRDSSNGLRASSDPTQESQDSTPEADFRSRTHSRSFKTSVSGHETLEQSPPKSKLEEDVLALVNVKPLVAIHERWISEANRKTERSKSLPEDNRSQTSAVKPASHCVDTLQQSLPQLATKKTNLRTYGSLTSHGSQSEQFCQARDNIAKSMNFAQERIDSRTWRKHSYDKGVNNYREELHISEPKVDQSTDTRSIEEFIRDLIRTEFHHLLHEISDDKSTDTLTKQEEILNKGVANVVDALKEESQPKKDPIKSFSRVKINGNNKPLVQITFSRSGENFLQVLDNCVNVTICDNSSGDKLNLSVSDETVTEDCHAHSLKRCQAFNAIQEARSTEDLYIDDDISTHMQENFGGRVRLLPLHGSLHEILCERADDCCLVKVKQENGCDSIYFKCDNSDTESRDAIDGPQDTVVYKRSISLVEERIQRVYPKDKRANTPVQRRNVHKDVPITRPKSEVIVQKISRESRVLSNSSPSLYTKDDRSDEVELNIENVMCYQDSSSDECLKCQVENDDFEQLEKEIEEDVANASMTCLACNCLEKISEENLSVINEESSENEAKSVKG
ncbi:uncharacterized protein LOC105390955 [Plutella xylostella]|uniref:uncharacterized protein LOC105390955 n=1 Tax=Plutella xylostella TaxID=51655 RepID=UPI002032F422|nr:uncharacterized protein LOC105390955 [Plutella xylostella]